VPNPCGSLDRTSICPVYFPFSYSIPQTNASASWIGGGEDEGPRRSLLVLPRDDDDDDLEDKDDVERLP
jgi:hypothetical protein